MHIAAALALLVVVTPAYAESSRPLRLDRAVEVRKTADPKRPAVLTLGEGERVWIGEEAGEFTRVRIKRAGGWRQGYVFTEDLMIPVGRRPAAEPEKYFGIGAMVNFSRMSQPGRQFQTMDMVRWTTSTYESQSVWPNLYLQFGRTDFWRLSVGARIVDFKGTARLDVDVNNSRSIEVKQTMYSGRIERAFTLYGPLFVSVGGEVARATSLIEYLDGVRVPTTEADLSVYAGASVGAGGEVAFGDELSALAEIRYAWYPSVKPAAQAVDLGLGLAYWF